MTAKVLVSAPYLQPVIGEFSHLFKENNIEVLIPKVNERLEEQELLKQVSEIDGALCGDDQFTRKVLLAAPKLKVISKWGTGIDSIDLDTCRQRGIVVCNFPGAFNEPVADSVLGYMLSFARRQPWMHHAMKRGVWEKIPGVALHECVLGIIGVGNVGRSVARRAAAFGMRLLGHDVVEIPEEFLSDTGMEMVSKDELLSKSDFLSLNCTLDPKSYHILSHTEFARMKHTAVVINTARGPLIDEEALIDAIDSEQIAGAALDVFEKEPLPARSGLLKFDNVLLAPHNANSSPTAWNRVHIRTIESLLSVLKRRS